MNRIIFEMFFLLIIISLIIIIIVVVVVVIVCICFIRLFSKHFSYLTNLNKLYLLEKRGVVATTTKNAASDEASRV